jgi:hypothetical protein
LGTALTVAVSAFFFFFSYRLRSAYFLFVFLIPFMPKYIGFGVGSEGFALSLSRILLMILLMWTAIAFVQNKASITHRISFIYQQNKRLINLFILFFLIKIFSLTINSREFSLYIMLFDDFLRTIFIIILTVLLIDSEKSIDKLMKVIFYGYAVALIFAYLDAIIKFPPLSVFASDAMKITEMDTATFFRDGVYRVNGSFSGPIDLGQYLVILFPIIRTYINSHRYSMIFKISFYVLTLYAIYLTHSRSAMLMFAILIYLYFILWLYRKNNRLFRFIGHLLNITLSIVVFYFTFNYIHTLIENFHGRFDLLGDEQTVSSTSRALQYVRIYETMGEAPFFGFGRMRNYTDMLESAIDNLLFWIVLEVGLIGVAFYLAFFYQAIKKSIHLYFNQSKNIYNEALIISFVCIFLYHFLSVTTNNHIFFYTFIGIICVMNVLPKKEQTA